MGRTWIFPKSVWPPSRPSDPCGTVSKLTGVSCNIGVKAKAEGGLGKINAKGLKKVGDSYVNDAYGESDTNLSVDVKGGVGVINLKVV